MARDCVTHHICDCQHEEVVELRKLCELVAAFSAPRLRENSLWILADAVDQANELLLKRVSRRHE